MFLAPFPSEPARPHAPSCFQMGTRTAHGAMLGTECRCWEMAGAQGADPSVLRPCHGLIKGVILPPAIYLIPQRIGSTAQGPSVRECWTRHICWNLGRATPARTGLCQKDPQSKKESELASNFKAIWRVLIGQICCSCCGFFPDPRGGENIWGKEEGVGEGVSD